MTIFQTTLGREPWPPPDEIEDLYYKSEVTNCSVSWLYLQYFAPNGSYVIGEPSRVDPSKRNRPFDMLQKIESLENDTPFQREALMCSNPARGAFLAVLAENKKHPQDPYGRVARLLCRPRFYRQTVLAMVSWPERSVQGLRDLGERQDIPENLFDTAHFSAQFRYPVDSCSTHGGVPTATWPLGTWNSDLDWVSSEPTFVTVMSFGQHPHKPLEEYLDVQNLRTGYEAAYKLLFARAMSRTLQTSAFETHTLSSGQMEYATEAVQVVPAFAYLVEVLLVINATIAASLAYIISRRIDKLPYEPGSIAALMSISADDVGILSTFKDLDKVDEKSLKKALEHRRFQLAQDRGRVFLTCDATANSQPAQTAHGSEFIEGVHPTEFRTLSISVFLVLQLSALIIFSRLYIQSAPAGTQSFLRTTYVRLSLFGC